LLRRARVRWRAMPYNDLADDPEDSEFPFGLNLLQATNDRERDFAVDYMLETIDMLYDLTEVGGPMFEMYFRNVLMLLLYQKEPEQTALLQNVMRLLVDSAYRKALIESCTSTLVRNFWNGEAGQAEGDLSLKNITPYFTSKLARFLYNGLLYPIFSQAKSTINMRQVMDEGKILLVNLRKGSLGALNSRFLGMMLVGELLKSAFSRSTDPNKASLPPFALYVDEFQNLATTTFTTMLSEARKYGLGLVLANQFLDQLRNAGTRRQTDIASSILGNAGTVVTFRLGGEDAELFSKVFGANLIPGDFMSLPNYHCYVRLLNSGSITSPFDLRTIKPEATPDSGALAQIQARTRKSVCRPIAEVVQVVDHAEEKMSENDIEEELKKLFGD